MQTGTGVIQVLDVLRTVKTLKDPAQLVCMLRLYPFLRSFTIKILQALMAKRPDHYFSVTYEVTEINPDFFQ